MKYQKGLIFICVLICLFSIAGVCASDINETIREDNSVGIENHESDTIENEQIDDVDGEVESEVVGESSDVLAAKENSVEMIMSSSENELPAAIAVSNDDDSSLSADQNKEVPLSKNIAEDSKLSASSSNIKLKSIKVHYNSGKVFNFRVVDYFSGEFVVYKGKSVYHSEYFTSSGGSYYWSLQYKNPGTYKVKFISWNGKTVASAKIIILKSKSKIKVKSFSARAGHVVKCYAYVKDKYSNRKYSTGTVKFRVYGKTFRAKLNNGVAVAKIIIPSKVKKYVCKAVYSGGHNVYGKSTYFKIYVKKSNLKKFKGKSKYTWRIKASTWKIMKKQARYYYNLFRSHGSFHPGYSNGVTVTLTKGAHIYTGTAFAVKNYRGIRCEVRGLPHGYRASTWGDY